MPPTRRSLKQKWPIIVGVTVGSAVSIVAAYYIIKRTMAAAQGIHFELNFPKTILPCETYHLQGRFLNGASPVVEQSIDIVIADPEVGPVVIATVKTDSQGHFDAPQYYQLTAHLDMDYDYTLRMYATTGYQGQQYTSDIQIVNLHFPTCRGPCTAPQGVAHALCCFMQQKGIDVAEITNIASLRLSSPGGQPFMLCEMLITHG